MTSIDLYHLFLDNDMLREAKFVADCLGNYSYYKKFTIEPEKFNTVLIENMGKSQLVNNFCGHRRTRNIGLDFERAFYLNEKSRP